ncbi:hypothetical protein ACFXTI_029326 [Malus domestica]
MLRILPKRNKGDPRRYQAIHRSQITLRKCQVPHGGKHGAQSSSKEIKSTGKAIPKKQEWQAMPKKQEGKVVPSLSKTDDEPAKPATTKGSRTPSKGPNTPVF